MNTTAKQLLKETIDKIEGAYAPSTIRAYRENFERFISFSEKLKASALPADSDTVTQYIKQLSGGQLKSASIRIAIASISAIHRLNQLIDPTKNPDVKLELRRMHRNLGRESKQAYGINKRLLFSMLAATSNDIHGCRNRAILLIAYDSMCRRSELVSLRIEDITTSFKDGRSYTKIKLRKSKTDQDAIGRWVSLSSESEQALMDWLGITKLDQGFIFRSITRDNVINSKITPSQINRIYKKVALEAGVAMKTASQISGHSLRVGAAQDLLMAGESLPIIMNKGRWNKTDTVMRYLEMAS
jgi:site-specific recombinase XerD